jgi:FixJ family two-component response regulator
VAVVDDDPSVRKSTQRLLASAGLVAKIFGSIEELLISRAILESDCLLLDVRLPGMDGLTLQEIFSQTHVPIIFLTGYASEDEEQRARRARAAGFLRKPVRADTLLSAVYGALAAHHQPE